MLCLCVCVDDEMTSAAAAAAVAEAAAFHQKMLLVDVAVDAIIWFISALHMFVHHSYTILQL